jgi:hypothetical protein
MHNLSDPKQMYHFFDLTFVCPPILSNQNIKSIISLSLTKCVICLTWHWSVHNFCLTYIDGRTVRMIYSQINVWVGQMSRLDKCLCQTNFWFEQMSGLNKWLIWTNVGVGQMTGLDKCWGWTNVCVGQMSVMDKCLSWTNAWVWRVSCLDKCPGFYFCESFCPTD